MKKAQNTIFCSTSKSRHLTLMFCFLLLLFFHVDFVKAQTADALKDQFDEAVRLYQFGEMEPSRQLFNEFTGAICDNPPLIDECVESQLYLSTFHRLDRKFEEAESYIDKASDIVLNELGSNHRKLVDVYVQYAYLYEDRSELDKALEWSRRAAELATEYREFRISASQAFTSRGYIEDSRGNYQNAINYYLTALEILSEEEESFELHRALSITHNNTGITYRKLGMYDDAMHHYQMALDSAIKAYGESHSEIAIIYNGIGTFYYSIGDLGTASEYFRQSAATFRKAEGENSNRLAILYNNLGLIHIQMDDYENALQFLERAQKIKLNIYGEEHIETAVGYHNLASSYLNNEEYEKAEKNYFLSLKIRQNIYGESHPNLILPYVNIANLYIQIERYSDAREVLNKALEIGMERLGESHPDVLGIYSQLGEIHEKEGGLTEAGDFYRKTISILIGETYKPMLTKVDLENVNYPVRLIETTKQLGELNIELYSETEDTENLYESLRLFDVAVSAIDFLQTQYQSEASKLRLIENHYSIFSAAIDVYYILFQQTGELVWLEEMIEFAEKGRSRVALDLLQDVKAKSFGGVPENVIAEERRLNKTVTDNFQNLHLEQEKGLDADSGKIQAYRDTLFHARRKLVEFTETLEENYPEYFALKYNRETASLDEIQQILKRDETALYYIFGRDHVYGLAIENDKIAVEKTAAIEYVNSEVVKLKEAVITRDDNTYKQIAYELYEALVDPLRPNINGSSLLIFPDQSLHYLPFEMLIDREAADKPYHKLSYLVNQFEIQYASSGTVFKEMQQRKPESPSNLLAFAPFNDSMNVTVDETETNTKRFLDGLTPLPLTAYETNQISKIFKNNRSLLNFLNPEKVTVLQNSDATKTQFQKQNLSSYGFIHFATHAFVNETNPDFSGIVLQGEGNDNGILYVSDIYNLQLNADLVVLGACETGLGSVHKGEGMIGFTRAFKYAGASNLVVSMWRVSDQPTAKLMISFYEKIQEDLSYGKALQYAKQQLIENPETAHPIHWAAFILNGS
ncbi:CHAT domain-containing tetratricopeptide repeat protein [Rhodohalobacter sp.]|uniref:CHAT domain-containing protein n=1 Tax=Rhodohalobacter sp. TaxID=1974210 RepID=UPI002ACE914D|nr:CHAT domain-containing tetratricopeptide repeat protein [Rhodohalobacter sp.]MDZ7758233.1 CHAT domain-containing tetratricopeptide repeat protein [Rhodohalobacter sp.]